MLPVVMQLGLFEKPMDEADYHYSHRCLLWMLECLVNCNREYLHHFPETPALYSKGPDGQRLITYTREAGTEDWCGIKVGLRTRKMDCEDLACWRVAELRDRGHEAAKPRVKFRNVEGFWHYHIQVEHASGKVEDPSRILGMNSGHEGKPISRIKMIRTTNLD
jgi:hypothetical protein